MLLAVVGIRPLGLGVAEVERPGAARLPHVHPQHATLEPGLHRVPAADLGQAGRRRVAHERVVAVIVAAQRHLPPTPKRGNIRRSTLSSIDAGSPRLDGLKPSPWLSKRNNVRAKPIRALITVVFEIVRL